MLNIKCGYNHSLVVGIGFVIVDVHNMTLFQVVVNVVGI
jgi:hypothetical protein